MAGMAGHDEQVLARLFHAAFRRSSNPMMLLDADRVIVDVNQAYCRLVGRQRNELIGHDSDFADATLTVQELRDAVSAGEITGNTTMIHRNGSTIEVEFSLSAAAADGDGRILAVITRLSRQQFTDRLTEREREVLRLVAAGKQGPEIAALLHVSEHTVRSHIYRAKRKLGARSRSHLIAKALASGIIF